VARQSFGDGQGLNEFKHAYASFGGAAATVMLVGVTHGLAGDRNAAEAELAKLQELGSQKYVPAVYSAFIYVALNDLDNAFEWLKKACEERSSYLIFLNVQPSMDNLRSDARFQNLLRTVGLRPLISL
jgi:hypothetical protein